MSSSIISTKQLTRHERFLLPFINGLVQYAKQNSQFGESLAAQIQERQWGTVSAVQIGFETPSSVTPTYQTQALSTARWILAQLDQHSEDRVLRNSLATWSRTYQDPKDLIIGIVGLAIIGPTLGLIENTKKTKSHMQVIVNEQTYVTMTPRSCAELVQEVSMQLLARELKLARGNIQNLHPDTAQWCLGDPATKIYTATEKELGELAEAALDEQLSIISKTTKDVFAAVAISPAVHDRFVEDFTVDHVVR